MKKWIVLLSVLTLALSLAACGAQYAADPADGTRTTAVNVNEFVDLYGCPNSKRTAKLQLKKRIYK